MKWETVTVSRFDISVYLFLAMDILHSVRDLIHDIPNLHSQRTNASTQGHSLWVSQGSFITMNKSVETPITQLHIDKVVNRIRHKPMVQNLNDIYVRVWSAKEF